MSDIPSRFYSGKDMAKVAAFFEGLENLIKEFEGDKIQPDEEHPLYVFNCEVVIRHRDDWTLGRFAMDDFLYWENTHETYGEKP